LLNDWVVYNGPPRLHPIPPPNKFGRGVKRGVDARFRLPDESCEGILPNIHKAW